MGWALDAIEALKRGDRVTVRPRGGSMRGRIEDGQSVTLAPVDPAAVVAGDVVLVRWKGGVLLHLVREARGELLLMANDVGTVNGWAPRSDALGRVVRVGDRGP
jgi:hypothetical protein